MSRVVLDASALLAYLNGEPGGEQVPATSGSALISAVNLSEVVSVLTVQGVSIETVRRSFSRIILDVISFDRVHAEGAGCMTVKTKSQGLSLGDRACLTLALYAEAPVLTADRAWRDVDVGVEIRFIR